MVVYGFFPVIPGGITISVSVSIRDDGLRFLSEICTCSENRHLSGCSENRHMDICLEIYVWKFMSGNLWRY